MISPNEDKISKIYTTGRQYSVVNRTLFKLGGSVSCGMSQGAGLRVVDYKVSPTFSVSSDSPKDVQLFLKNSFKEFIEELRKDSPEIKEFSCRSSTTIVSCYDLTYQDTRKLYRFYKDLIKSRKFRLLLITKTLLKYVTN